MFLKIKYKFPLKKSQNKKEPQAEPLLGFLELVLSSLLYIIIKTIHSNTPIINNTKPINLKYNSYKQNIMGIGNYLAT